MQCIIALESKVSRIAGPGMISAGHPALTETFDAQSVPRVGEFVFLQTEGATNKHVVTSVRYVAHRGGILGATVMVDDGVPVQR